MAHHHRSPRSRFPLLPLGLGLLAIAAIGGLLWLAIGGEGDPVATTGTEADNTDVAAGTNVATTEPEAGSEPQATSESEAAKDTDVAAETDVATDSGQPEPEPEPDPASLPLPEDAPSMVAALDRAELAIRDASLTNAQLDSWGRRQQSLYRHLSFHPEWAPDVTANTDPAVRAAVALNWQARQNLSSLVNTETLHAELPAWRVVPPLPPQTLVGYYKQAEADYGIEWEFLAAINLIETRMGRIEGISTAGAIGPMQFLPTTWAECCDGDPSVPADAIPGAAKYLTIRGGPENMNRAIFGYNNSDYYVDAVTAYATVMMEDERAYYGYHAWEIYFLSTEGLIRIPVGYEQLEPIAAAAWLLDNPETLFAR